MLPYGRHSICLCWQLGHLTGLRARAAVTSRSSCPWVRASYPLLPLWPLHFINPLCKSRFSYWSLAGVRWLSSSLLNTYLVLFWGGCSLEGITIWCKDLHTLGQSHRWIHLPLLHSLLFQSSNLFSYRPRWTGEDTYHFQGDHIEPYFRPLLLPLNVDNQMSHLLVGLLFIAFWGSPLSGNVVQQKFTFSFCSHIKRTHPCPGWICFSCVG